MPFEVDWVPRLALTAFVIFIIGMVLIVLASLTRTGASAGGVVFIGPIPLIFGAGTHSELLILIGLITVVAIAAFLLLYRRIQ